MTAKQKKIALWITAGLMIYLLYLLRDILLPFIMSGILIYLMAPAVNFLVKPRGKLRLSRGLAVVLVYLGTFICLGLIFILVLPPLYTEFLRITQQIPVEITNFRANTLPHWLDTAERFNSRYDMNLDLEKFLDQSLENLTGFASHQIEILPHRLQFILERFMSALSTFLVIFIVTGFVLMDLPQIKQKLHSLIPPGNRETVLTLLNEMNKDLSGTIRGQLMICLINGILTTVGLLLIQVKFAVTIGFIAGIFSIIPVFGALISTIPAVLIGLTQSVGTAIAIVVMIAVIHLLEANVLNPKILGHTVELHPAIIVFAILVGEHFFGAIGLLFAVPVAAILRSVVKFIYLNYFLEETTHEHESI